MKNLKKTKAVRLLFRVAPTHEMQFALSLPDGIVGKVQLIPSDSWQESSLTIDGSRVSESLRVTLTNTGPSALELFHLWAVQANE